jgi:hypothetical protein
VGINREGREWPVWINVSCRRWMVSSLSLDWIPGFDNWCRSLLPVSDLLPVVSELLPVVSELLPVVSELLPVSKLLPVSELMCTL